MMKRKTFGKSRMFIFPTTQLSSPLPVLQQQNASFIRISVYTEIEW